MSTLNKMAGMVLSALLLTGMAGCEQKPAENTGKTIDRAMDNTGNKMSQAAEAAKEKAAKADSALDDAAITAKVKTALVAEPRLSALEINVHTSGGAVTLKGTVDSAADAERAKAVAAKVKGVASVDSQLTVKDAKLSGRAWP